MDDKERTPNPNVKINFSKKDDSKSDLELLEELMNSLHEQNQKEEKRTAQNPKQLTLDNLRKQLHAKEQEFQLAQKKRFNLIQLLFSIGYLLLLLIIWRQFDLTAIVFCAVAALLLGKIHFWANGAIFTALRRFEQENKEQLDDLSKRIRDLEKNLEN